MRRLAIGTRASQLLDPPNDTSLGCAFAFPSYEIYWEMKRVVASLSTWTGSSRRARCDGDGNDHQAALAGDLDSQSVNNAPEPAVIGLCFGSWAFLLQATLH